MANGEQAVKEILDKRRIPYEESEITVVEATATRGEGEGLTVKIGLRPFECLVEGSVQYAPWQRCLHGKHVVHAQAYWSDDMPTQVTTGRQNSTQRFPITRHADGTVLLEPEWRAVVPEFVNNVKCPKCGDLDSHERRQEAYGDRVWCTTPGCGWNAWYSIGD